MANENTPIFINISSHKQIKNKAISEYLMAIKRLTKPHFITEPKPHSISWLTFTFSLSGYL